MGKFDSRLSEFILLVKLTSQDTSYGPGNKLKIRGLALSTATQMEMKDYADRHFEHIYGVHPDNFNIT